MPDSRDQRVYDLNPLKRRGFQFRYSPTSGIVDVRLKQIKFQILGGESQRIIVDVNPSRNRDSLYDVLDDVLHTGDPNTSGNRIPLSLVNVMKVGIKGYFVPDRHRKKLIERVYVDLQTKHVTALKPTPAFRALFGVGIEVGENAPIYLMAPEEETKDIVGVGGDGGEFISIVPHD